MSGFVHLRKTPSRLSGTPVRSEISLTESEDQLCTLLDECTQKLQEERGLTTSCRIAGGWVRDKLLGLESNDIDIALTDMMGHPFAEHFVAFVESKGLEIKGVAKIESRPEQSKHLETACTTVLGIDLDFVNLRSEEYAEGSRIPTAVTFGTPLQDALRRDITINALFYNVHSRTVEDHTEMGLPDLRNGIIRTPLTPIETFRDDPLRVVRCVRFASRFGFEMVPELQEAARDPAIQDVLCTILSRERVGQELDKMMKGPDPVRALQLIQDLSLPPSLFALPPSLVSLFSSPPTSFSVSVAAATLLQATSDPSPSHPLPPLHPTLRTALEVIPSSAPRLFLGAALTMFKGITYLDSKNRERCAVEAVIRTGLKLGTLNHYMDGVPWLFAAAWLLKNPDLERFKDRPERVSIGLLLRNKAVHNPYTGTHWTTSILFSVVQELLPLYDVINDKLNIEEATRCINKYNTFVHRIEELNLPASLEAKPLLDGHELSKILEAEPGPWTGQVTTNVIEWQLEHPDGTKDECAEWLRSEHNAGKIRTDWLGEEVSGKRWNPMGEGSSSKKTKR